MNIKKLSAAVVGAILTLLTMPAFAVVVPGDGGFPSPRSSCFNDSAGAVSNTCASTQIWVIPLAVNSGSHTVTLQAATSGLTTCTLYAQSQFGVLTPGTSWTPSGTGGIETGQVSVTVPSSGSAFVYCSVAFDDTIWSASYSH